MISSSLFTAALALFAINGVNAGPCRPSSALTTDTSTAVETTPVESSGTTSDGTTATLPTSTDVSVTTTETTTISEAASSTETSTDDTTTLLLITTTTQDLQETTTTEPATTTTTAIVEEPECKNNADCQALNDGANPICDSGLCVPVVGSPCSDDSDCPVPGETCSADGFCQVNTTSGGDSCRDSIDCLLSLNPLCVLGLCTCTSGACVPGSD